MLKERSTKLFVGKSKSRFTARIRLHPMTEERLHAIIESDKKQFLSVPGATCFVRNYYPGEFMGASMPREMRLDSVTHVLVKRLSDGQPLRVPMTADMAEDYIEDMQMRTRSCILRTMALLLPQKMGAEYIPVVLEHIKAIVSSAVLVESAGGRMKVEVECSPLQEEMFHCYASSIFDAKRFEE